MARAGVVTKPPVLGKRLRLIQTHDAHCYLFRHL